MSFFKSIWKVSSKHEKLSEELALQNAKEAESAGQVELIENENDVITFKLKYLGSTVVEKIVGDSISTEAVKNIIKVAKASRKKMQRINIAISLKGIAVTDLLGNDIFKVSIYRISNCSTDPTHRQVFSFISTDTNETMECHAFLCSKRKITETVTLAVARAFSTAYEAWRILPAPKQFVRDTSSHILDDGTTKEVNNAAKNQQNVDDGANELQNNDHDDGVVIEVKLIDFDDDHDDDFDRAMSKQQHNQWVCFEDDFTSADVQRTGPTKSNLILI